MKGYLKLKCSGFSVLFLILSMLNVGNVDINEDNIRNYLDSDCYSVAEYIDNNFNLFVSKYNEFSDNQKLSASYIESKFSIVIDQAGVKSEGVFLDFNQDNGFVIVGDEYTFYDFRSVEILHILV